VFFSCFSSFHLNLILIVKISNAVLQDILICGFKSTGRIALGIFYHAVDRKHLGTVLSFVVFDRHNA